MDGYLSEHADPNPQVSSRWLVSSALGLSKVQLYTNADQPIEPSELDLLRGYVKRRAAGEPLQYITGKTFFRHIDVEVERGVLIPRPETEVLVSEILRRLPVCRFTANEAGSIVPDAAERVIRVAEVGCGSGCIACSLAYENPAVEVFASDILPEAVALTARNAQLSGVASRVHPVECDLGEALEGPFAAVVSNPPYIPTSVLPELPVEVTEHEPRIALDGGPDGLDVFRRLVAWAPSVLEPDGFLACELHEACLDAAARVACDAGFATAEVIDDLAGKPRVLVASLAQCECKGAQAAPGEGEDAGDQLVAQNREEDRHVQ